VGNTDSPIVSFDNALLCTCGEATRVLINCYCRQMVCQVCYDSLHKSCAARKSK
jgi:hypothetical protein